MGKIWKQWQIFWGSKIAASCDYTHEIKRCLLLGRKTMTNLDSMLKSRDITLPTKIHLVKAMIFPIVMSGCESGNIKKAEHQRIDAFELWCWRRLLRVPWTARRSNQSILKRSLLNIHWKDWCWSWNSNTLATWYEELTHLKRPWCLERLKVGGEGDNRGWDGWMASLTQWTWVWVRSGSYWWTGKSGMLQSMGSQRVRHDWVTELIARLISRKVMAPYKQDAKVLISPYLFKWKQVYLSHRQKVNHLRMWQWSLSHCTLSLLPTVSLFKIFKITVELLS